jgi:hypothetical protein
MMEESPRRPWGFTWFLHRVAIITTIDLLNQF